MRAAPKAPGPQEAASHLQAELGHGAIVGLAEAQDAVGVRKKGVGRAAARGAHAALEDCGNRFCLPIGLSADAW